MQERKERFACYVCDWQWICVRRRKERFGWLAIFSLLLYSMVGVVWPLCMLKWSAHHVIPPLPSGFNTLDRVGEHSLHHSPHPYSIYCSSLSISIYKIFRKYWISGNSWKVAGRLMSNIYYFTSATDFSMQRCCNAEKGSKAASSFSWLG